MIHGADHVALSVADLDRSIAFYSTLFGFEVRRRLPANPELPLGQVIGVAGAAADIAHLYLGEFMLELFRYHVPAGRPPPPERTQADHGYIHFGLRVSDVHCEAARLRAAGVRFLSAPVQFRAGVWVVYFQGPDGEVVELRQAPEERR